MKAFAACAIGDMRRLRASRTAILVLGGLCVVLALGADLLLPLGAGAGFGVKQRLLLLIGLLLVVPALLVPSRHFDRLVLFYMNDLSDRELDPMRFTVSGGYLVHRIDE